MADEVKVDETQTYATDEEGTAAAAPEGEEEEAAAEAAETADPEGEE